MDIQKVTTYLQENHVENIKKAGKNLEPILYKTPLIQSEYFSKEHNMNVYIKPENLQRTGSFKIRGAFNKIINLSDKEKEMGVIAASAGNHAQGVAYSARENQIKSTIVMPEATPLLKVDATKACGSRVLLHGSGYDEAYAYAKKLAKEEDLIFVHPFDDYEIVCGQATIGLEILEELPEVDEILVPIGGGGLIAGIALAVKSVKPSVKIIGVSPQGSTAMKISLEEGQVTRLAETKTVAEGVAVKKPGDLTFAISKEYVDEIVTVSDKEIMEAVLFLIEKHKIVAETAGAISLAALRKIAGHNKNVVSVISGGNIDVLTISEIINRALISRGRIMCFSVEIPDQPGHLVKVVSVLAEKNANVLEIEHNPFKAVERFSNKVLLEATVETNGHEHIAEIIEALEDHGFTINRVY